MGATRANLLISLIEELDRLDDRISDLTRSMDRRVTATRTLIDEERAAAKEREHPDLPTSATRKIVTTRIAPYARR